MKILNKNVNNLKNYFGSSLNLITLFSKIAISLSIGVALISLLFIVLSIITSLSIDPIKVIFDYRHISSLENSLIIACLVSFFLVFLSTIFSLIFRWCGLTGNKFIYGISVLPILIPDQIWGVCGRMIFNPSIGFLKDLVPNNILSDRIPAISIISFITILKWFPIMTVIADSSIYSLGTDLLNQITIDFRSFFKAAKKIYLPNMKIMISIIGSIGFLIGFKQHELAYELTSSGSGFIAETWSVWNYKEMFEFAKIPKAALEAIFTLIVLMIPILIIRILVKRFEKNEN